jgi:hypothetical protein
VYKSELSEQFIYHHAEEGHHHHLVCNQCGKTIDCDEDLLAPLERLLAEKHGFQINFRHIVMSGLCNKDFPLVGVFATGSPVCPNPILTTVARLLERRGNLLKVTGLDALDGSPILDIKPYFRDAPDADEIKVPDWVRDIHQTFAEEVPSE